MYESVLAQIDLNMLQRDPNYCQIVMSQLLQEKRVHQYLENGLQEQPEIPSGEYIGGIMKQDGRYSKFFDQNVGREAHYSQAMKNKRYNHKMYKQQLRQEEINRRKKEIARLQNEINEM